MDDKILKELGEFLEDYSCLSLKVLDKNTLQVVFKSIVVLTLMATPKKEFYLESFITIDDSCIVGNSFFYPDSKEILDDVINVIKRFVDILYKFREIVKQLDCTEIEGECIVYSFDLNDDNLLVLSLSNLGFATTMYCKNGINLDKEYLELIMYVSNSLNTPLIIKTTNSIDVSMKEIKFFTD